VVRAARALLVVLLMLAVGGEGLAVAGITRGAAAVQSPRIGYDISYPDCGAPFPASRGFAIVGVNDGHTFSANPCLGAGDGPSELAWAGMHAAFYVNTGDPGPRSTHWPVGQRAPKACDTAAKPGANTTACAYDYGWDAAANSYRDAVAAYASLGWAPAGATRTPVGNTWWLDVESANTWLSRVRLNVSELQGEVDYLVSAGAASVGVYAPSANWQSITGGTTRFSAYQAWMPGPGSLSQAKADCTEPSSTGGSLVLTQYPAGGFDGDYRCAAAPPRLSFTTTSQRLARRSASKPMRIGLSTPASSPVSIALTSTSPGGAFALSPNGPWTVSTSVLIPAGSTKSGRFYYRDTSAGRPLLVGSAAGFTDATQHETIGSGGTRSKGLTAPASRPAEGPRDGLPTLLPARPGG
jgi:hypothetical protein